MVWFEGETTLWGSGASAQIDSESERIMKEIRAGAKEYRPELTYNIDELGYY